MCVKLCIITRKVSRQIKKNFQRIETYSSSFRMLKEFECTSYFKATSLHPRKSVFSFAEQLMIRYKIQTKNSQKCNLLSSLLTDVVVLTPSDEILPSAYPSAKLNSATSTNQNLPSKFWKVTSVDLGAE